MIDLQPGEKILATRRQHWVILSKMLIPSAFLFAIGLLVPEIWNMDLIVKYVGGIMAQIVAVFFLANSLEYFLDVWVITNMRTVYIELHGFFNISVSSVTHDRVQDITVSVPGFLATIFNYGDLQIETAGRFEKMIMEMIPDPNGFKDMILKLVEAQKTVEVVAAPPAQGGTPPQNPMPPASPAA